MPIDHKPDILQRLKDGDPTRKKETAKNSFYDVPFPQKKLWLIWETGQMKFFYYSYLMDANFENDREMDLLTLYFVAKKLVLKGYNLRILFQLFLEDKVKLIPIVDSRYVCVLGIENYLVTEGCIEI